MRRHHPYRDLSPQRYWRSSASVWGRDHFAGLYEPKFPIDHETRIATGGSCFAQHIARNLRLRGYRFLDFEPAPPLLPARLHAQFGYGLYSARFGNIYTSRQLVTIVQEAYGKRLMNEVWEADGRFYDPMRPSIEVNGFASREEVLGMRQSHLAAVRRMMEGIDLFVFTLGLTETWINRTSGIGYQTCPGTVAGTFDAQQHAFVNLGHADVLSEMERVIRHWRTVNPSVRFLLTVSPVPLAATATDRHVVQATTYSKSVLRAVAGDLAQRHDFIDYFPSYEIITAPLSGGRAYDANMRDVREEAVGDVMGCFFAAHGDTMEQAEAAPLAHVGSVEAQKHQAELAEAMKVVCDEAVLDQSLSA